jgi:NAD-dependent deacetylase
MQPISLTDYAQVVFFTGAGMSAESGVPTYRGAGGIWGQYKWEEYACQAAFERDAQKVLDFHERRRGTVLACQPHAGHLHLAALQAAHPRLSIITQNTDGMHQRAGARAGLELHGSLWRLRCGAHGSVEDVAAAAYARRDCAHCGATLRPDIVWFADHVDQGVFARAGQLIAEADLFVAVGTSGVVWPAAGLVHAAHGGRARMIEINPEATELSGLFDDCVRDTAGAALPRLFPLPAAR